MFYVGPNMKTRVQVYFLAAGILGAAFLLSPGILFAQAPAGPLPAAQPKGGPASTAKPQEQQQAAQTRTSIFGAWKLNRDDSDDPRKKMQEARGNRGSGRGGGIHVGGPRMGSHGGYGGHRGGSESDEDRERMQELFRPANSLNIVQKDSKDPEIDVTDDQNRKLALFTDGRKVQKPNPKDDSYQEIAAHWDDKRLVTDEKSPRGGKMSRTYELSYDGTQLYETLRLTTDRSNEPVVIRFVYDQAPQTKP